MRHRKTLMIIIETSNAAFDDHECGEVSRILRTFCRELPDVLPPGTNGLYDINGNTCGRVEITRND